MFSVFGVTRKSRTACFLGDMRGYSSGNVFAVIDELLKINICTFIFSADTLFCLECAKQVVLRKKKQRGNILDKIKLIGIIPFEEHINHRSEKFRSEYFEVLEKCDEVMTFDKEQNFVASDFSEFILNKSSILVCPEKGSEYEKLYAQAMDIKIIGIH